jgi:hypothetical protein
METQDRKLIYFNMARGVTAVTLAKQLNCSEEEVNHVFREVGLLLASWQVHNAHPYTPCQTVQGARQNLKVLLPMLDAVDLGSIVTFARVRAAMCRVES